MFPQPPEREAVSLLLKLLCAIMRIKSIDTMRNNVYNEHERSK